MILFDMDMPKWVLFFNPIIKKLKKLNYEVIITSRGGEDYSELNKVLNLYNLEYISIGEYGGSTLEGKLKASIDRQTKLIDIIKDNNIKIVVSGSVVDINRVGFGLGLKVINFNDIPTKGYLANLKDITAVTRLTAPFSTIIFKPFMVDNTIFNNLGLSNEQIINYNFIDPLIWLKDFKLDINYIKKEIPQINYNIPIVVVREEEFKASYVDKRYDFLDKALEEFENWDINLIIIPRYNTTHLKKKFKKAIILEKKIILQHLLGIANLFIGGGGTINTEATYFGVPVISTRSFITHYDKFLIDNKLMVHSNNTIEIINLAKELMLKDNKSIANSVFSRMELDIDNLVDKIIN